MQYKPLHIVSFNTPYPPNYGGVIEVYFKVKALHEIGYTIFLHCFVRELPQDKAGLENIVQEVYFYKTSKSLFRFLSGVPFSVASRNSKALLENILKTDAPVLFESTKTAYFAGHEKLYKRIKVLRLHNIEHDYFNGISKSEKNIFRKILYKAEAIKYKKFEQVIHNFDATLTLSLYETNQIEKEFGKALYIPVFHGNDKVAFLSGKGNYALYHGDLTISDNLRTALFLIKIFSESLKNYPLVIASGSGEAIIKNAIGKSSNISYVALQNFEHLKELLNNAHINIIYSFQRSGTKLKLINSLFYSRFCIINSNIIDDPVVSSLCVQANSAQEIIKVIITLFKRDYDENQSRKKVLETYMDDIANARKIDEVIVSLIQEKN